MNTYNLGTIFQRKQGKSFVYYVRIISKKLHAKFYDEKEAIAYAEMHSRGILKTNEIHSVSVKYERADGRASFIVLSNVINQNEEIEIEKYEESAYDYIQSNTFFFKEHRNRTKMNERYYSFHDAARVTTITSRRGNLFRGILGFALVFMSLMFAAWGYHLIDASNYIDNNKLNVDYTYFNWTILTIILLSWIMVTLIFLSFYLPYRAAKKKEWTYGDVNWRKYYKLKRRLSWAALFFLIAAGTVTAIYSYRYFTSDIFKYKHKLEEAISFDVISWVYAGLALLVAFAHVYEMLQMYKRESRVMPKYFNKKEITNFKLWIKGEDVPVPYKTDKDFFVYNVEHDSKIVLTKIIAFEEIKRSTSYDQLEEFSRKATMHYKSARKAYLHRIRNGEN